MPLEHVLETGAGVGTGSETGGFVGGRTGEGVGEGTGAGVGEGSSPVKKRGRDGEGSSCAAESGRGRRDQAFVSWGVKKCTTLNEMFTFARKNINILSGVIRGC